MGICTSLCCYSQISQRLDSSQCINNSHLPRDNNNSSRKNNLILLDSPPYRNSIMKSFDSECIICFHNLNDNQLVSNNCSKNNCRLDAHQYCVYNWYLRHRKCPICNEIEDEEHILFSCVIFNSVRNNFISLVRSKYSCKLLLNPCTEGDVISVGKYLTEIEKHYKSAYNL